MRCARAPTWFPVANTLRAALAPGVELLTITYLFHRNACHSLALNYITHELATENWTALRSVAKTVAAAGEGVLDYAEFDKEVEMVAHYMDHDYHWKHIGMIEDGAPDACQYHNMEFAMNTDVDAASMHAVCDECERPRRLFARLLHAARRLPGNTDARAELLQATTRCAQVCVRLFGYTMRRQAQRREEAKLQRPDDGVIHITQDFKKKVLAAMHDETMLDCTCRSGQPVLLAWCTMACDCCVHRC